MADRRSGNQLENIVECFAAKEREVYPSGVIRKQNTDVTLHIGCTGVPLFFIYPGAPAQRINHIENQRNDTFKQCDDE